MGKFSHKIMCRNAGKFSVFQSTIGRVNEKDQKFLVPQKIS
jgi:hypothetical protein